MLKAPIPPDEPERMKALHEYGVLDTPPERRREHEAQVYGAALPQRRSSPASWVLATLRTIIDNE
jgi:hypothetical protein